MITVKSHKVPVDIQLELEPYLDQFDQYRVRDDKLQSCSPFRQDRHPSFAVNLENGTWIDSGSTGYYSKGHFVTLLAFLREEDVNDTAEYLLDSYQIERQEVDTLQLDMKIPVELELPFLTAEYLQQFAFRHPYLSRRGITDEVQRLFRVGYSKEYNAVAMPHTDRAGNLTNIKFRTVTDKKFWYSGGQAVKLHLYGLYQCLQAKASTVWIVESEIDCMRLWSEGKYAVALGTAHISKRQLQLLKASGFSCLIIATDNDSAGRECAEELVKLLGGIFTVKKLAFSIGLKDICDMTSVQIANAVLTDVKTLGDLGGLSVDY